MIEAKYFKDYKHNYMILRCDGAGAGENYHRSMLAQNRIDGILKCSVRNINADSYLYYDISSKVTLENLYTVKKMSYEQVRDFFSQMDMIYRNLGKYFMEEKGLLMQPDCIFYDFSPGKYFGLYYPGANINNENAYEPLMDFLLSHADMENQKLADIIYTIYEMSENPFFSLTDVLRFFDETADYKDIVTTMSHADIFEEMKIEQSDEAYENNVEVIEKNDRDYDRKHKSKIAEEQKKNTVYYIVFAVISLFGIGAAVWIYQNYDLTGQELMMIMCCMVVMGICLIFSVSQILSAGKKIRKKEQEERRLLDDIEDEFRNEREVVLQNVLDKGMNTDTYNNCDAGYEADANKILTEEKIKERIWAGQDITKTIFIDSKMQNTEYKLYALDNKNKMHIELTKFPFTIGKMAGCADFVLSDDSVSRLHARIEKHGDKIFLTDMNSMNGTYKNGLRMEPSETLEIEPGDEIRFGKLNYCYR